MSNLEFWALRSKTEEEKRLFSWDEEKLVLETEIKEISKQLNALQKQYLSDFNKKEKILADMRKDFQDKEENKKKSVKAKVSTVKKKAAKSEAAPAKEKKKPVKKKVAKPEAPAKAKKPAAKKKPAKKKKK